MIEFNVASLPIAQPRQRHRVVTNNGKAFASNYTPSKAPINEFKAAVKMSAQHAYDGAPLHRPLRVELVFVFKRPKNAIWQRKEMPRIRHTKKPDVDNLVKGLCDSLNGLTYRDDAQICELHVEKWIASGDEQPHVEVRIRELEF